MPFVPSSPSIDDSSPHHNSKPKSYPPLRYPDISDFCRTSIVRFRLPLTPPLQVIDMPAKYKEVGTQEAGPEVFKVKDSGSKWRRRDLELLGVEYRYDKFDEVEIPVNFMPLELVARIVPFLML